MKEGKKKVLGFAFVTHYGLNSFVMLTGVNQEMFQWYQ